MRIENWNGYDIRFVELEGEWWAVLKDICDALGLRTDGVTQRLESDMVRKVRIDVSDHISSGTSSRARKSQDMSVVNELGIYEALFASRRPEARRFRAWTASVLQRLRSYVGLHGYEALRMTEKEIQDDIDQILDLLFWDDEKKQLMVSYNVPGGDVETMPFDEYVKEHK